MKITIEAFADADPQTAWDVMLDPEHIKQWNAANDDWHTPSSSVDLRVGGRMESRMEAKDGSMGFDFGGTFTEVDPPRRVAYRLDDGRMVEVVFIPEGDGVRVRETFDAEEEHDADFQRQGWQAILDSFARHVTTLRHA